MPSLTRMKNPDLLTELGQKVDLLETLSRIEAKLDAILGQPVVKDYYTTAEVAQIVRKVPFTIRKWCLRGRIRAEKRPCGRGRSKEWMVSHSELLRLRSTGLLPIVD